MHYCYVTLPNGERTYFSDTTSDMVKANALAQKIANETGKIVKRHNVRDNGHSLFYPAPPPSEYTVRKVGDNFGLYFRGGLVESGVFATRATANKHKRIAENDRRAKGTA